MWGHVQNDVRDKGSSPIDYHTASRSGTTTPPSISNEFQTVGATGAVIGKGIARLCSNLTDYLFRYGYFTVL